MRVIKSQLSLSNFNNVITKRSFSQAFPKKIDFSALLTCLIVRAGFHVESNQSVSMMTSEFHDKDFPGALRKLKSLFRSVTISPHRSSFDILRESCGFFANPGVAYLHNASSLKSDSNIDQYWENLSLPRISGPARELLYTRCLDSYNQYEDNQELILMDQLGQFFVPRFGHVNHKLLKKKHSSKLEALNYFSISYNPFAGSKPFEQYQCLHATLASKEIFDFDALGKVERYLVNQGVFTSERTVSVWMDGHPNQGLEATIEFFLRLGIQIDNLHAPSLVFPRDPIMTLAEFLSAPSDTPKIFIDIDWVLGEILVLVKLKEAV